MTLRPYQEKGRSGLRHALREHRAALYCLPCGGGKGTITAVMVHGAVSNGKRVIFAVRGKTLVADMSERVGRLGVEHGVLMGGMRRERWHPVQVASIDTLHRMSPLPPADLIIIDEARTFESAKGRQVLDSYPQTTKIVGLDATPLRADGKGLGSESGGIFDVMIMGPDEQELIDLGFLVPSVPIGIPNPPDVRKVKITAGKFNDKELAVACKTATRVGDIVEHWVREAFGRKTVAFGIDRADAQDITAKFRSAGIEWEYVDANTPNEERAKIWDRLRHGTLMGFSNVGIAGCGFDIPIISCVISGAPRYSLSQWRQEIGRGSRIHPESGKKDFIILDHSGNFARHHPNGYFEVPPIWTLDGGIRKPSDDDPKPAPVATCKVPILVPDSGAPATFTGPLSPDGLYMLPSYHTFRAGPNVCPYCGIPLRIDGNGVEVEAGDLQDLSGLREKAKDEAKVQSAAQLAYDQKLKKRYFELVKIGRTNGYKSGWPSMALKIEFHKFPKKEWKAEADVLYGAAPKPPENQLALI